MSDQLVDSPLHDNTVTTDKHPCPRRDSKAQSAADLRLRRRVHWRRCLFQLRSLKKSFSFRRSSQISPTVIRHIISGVNVGRNVYRYRNVCDTAAQEYI